MESKHQLHKSKNVVNNFITVINEGPLKIILKKSSDCLFLYDDSDVVTDQQELDFVRKYETIINLFGMECSFSGRLRVYLRELRDEE